MPLSVERITQDSTLQFVRDMINSTIDHLVHKEGKTPKEAAGQAYGMAEGKWGKAIPKAS